LIISASADLAGFRRLLGNGDSLGLSISYTKQDEPRGLADAFIIGANHVGTDSVALILGDNIFHGAGFSELLRKNMQAIDGCVLFSYLMHNPERYGPTVSLRPTTRASYSQSRRNRLTHVRIGQLPAYNFMTTTSWRSRATCVPRCGRSWRSPMSTECI
jgi:NDP-sugar pyrophosphorylase family protein